MATTTTLGKLRYRLAVRLGFATDGIAAQRQSIILNDFINSAYYFLYWSLEDDRHFKMAIIKTGLGQSLYELPTDMETGKSMRFWFRRSEHHKWHSLTRDLGFKACIEEADLMQHTPFMRAQLNHPHSGYPYGYRIIGTQIEIAPASCALNDEIRIDYWQKLNQLVDDNDEPFLDGEAIFHLSLTNAKAHYQQEDGQLIGKQYQVLNSNLRAAQHVDRRYTQRGYR